MLIHWCKTIICWLRSYKRQTGVCVFFIIVFHLLAYNATVFAGKPISKLFVLSQEDSLYSPQIKDWQIRSKFDPCVYFFQQPTSYQIDRIWSEKVIPFWNPNSSAGQPIMAHIESGVFSWMRYLFPVRSEYFYNLGIVYKLIAASIGVFVLARLLQVNNLFALLSALIFSFCPYIIREVELDKETWTYSWVLASFIYFSHKMSWRNATLLGGTTGYICATIHPECSFNVIVLSCFFVLAQAFCADVVSVRAVLNRVVIKLGYLMGVGVIALATCSPVFFPFIEYMRTGDCYKFENISPPIVPALAFILSLINPVLGGNSPFLGIVALPCLILGLISISKKTIPLFMTLLLSVLIVTAAGPLDALFKLAPFNRLEPIYVQPFIFVLASVALSSSLEQVLQKARRNRRIVFCGILLLTAVSPLAWGSFPHLFDNLVWDAGMEAFAINKNALNRDIFIAIFISILVCCSLDGSRVSAFSRRVPYLTAVVIVSLSLFSELCVARNALPTHKSFNYPLPASVAHLLQSSKEVRVMATGRHFIWPNIFCVWDVSDFRAFNSLYPPGFLKFQEKCGGRKYFASHFRYEDGLTPFTDFASVDYILSRGPVWDDCVRQYLSKVTSKPLAQLQSGEQIISSDLYFEPNSNSVFAYSSIFAQDAFLASSTYQLAVLDKSGDEVWLSDMFPLQFYREAGCAKILANWVIPESKRIQDVDFSIRFSHNLSYAPIYPSKTAYGQHRNLILYKPQQKTKNLPHELNSRFSLVKTFDDVRVYRCTRSLPHAFMVFHATNVKDQNEAFEELSKKSFDPFKQVIIENYLGSWRNGFPREKLKELSIIRPNANQVIVRSDRPGMLVINEAFYPGWKAQIDGVATKVYRANAYFRAIEVPEGRHEIVFSYVPSGFMLGVYLFAGTWLVLLGINLFVFVKQAPNIANTLAILK